MADIISSLLPAIETELQRQVSRLDEPHTQGLHEMLAYHMGWTGEGSGPEATGKRIRPLLLLLAYASVSPSAAIEDALPAAAAVELVHNYSLVHDDIEDNSELRRGRATLWAKWGNAQAINAGDGLYALSQLAFLDLADKFPAEVVLQGTRVLQEGCLSLARGQFLDISYQQRRDLRVEDYWPMVGGKTAALLSACCHLGALLAGADLAKQDAFRSFGNYLGLAFQIQDDILGIWGEQALTGKSTTSDLVEGKKSLPVLVGLGRKGEFAAQWEEGPVSSVEAPRMAALLAEEGGYRYAQDAATQMTDLALESLRAAEPQGEAGDALGRLAEKLLRRSA